MSQSDRVDALIANSGFIAERIRAAYGRESKVVFPFVDTARFKSYPRKPAGFYLMGYEGVKN